jgi:hypothetical protein
MMVGSIPPFRATLGLQIALESKVVVVNELVDVKIRTFFWSRSHETLVASFPGQPIDRNGTLSQEMMSQSIESSISLYRMTTQLSF